MVFPSALFARMTCFADLKDCSLIIRSRTNARDAGAVGTGENELEPIFQTIVPADGIMLPIGESGDFGSSPFFGQLMGRAASACLHPVTWRAGPEAQ
jgi:hypothetical protein